MEKVLDDKIYDSLPEHLRSGIYNYIEKKIKPGSFLRAVIENNLVESITRFDNGSFKDLKDIVNWFIWQAPSKSWGSLDKMNNWLNKSDKTI